MHYGSKEKVMRSQPIHFIHLIEMLADLLIIIDGKFILLMYLFTIIALIFILSTDLFDFLITIFLVIENLRHLPPNHLKQESVKLSFLLIRLLSQSMLLVEILLIKQLSFISILISLITLQFYYSSQIFLHYFLHLVMLTQLFLSKGPITMTVDS